MSDAPDKIWICPFGGNWSPVAGGTQTHEYVKADRIEALQAEVREMALQYLATAAQAQEALEELERLRVALNKIANGTTAEAEPDTGELIECWMGADEMQEIARAALDIKP